MQATERYCAYHNKASTILGHGLMLLASREFVDDVVLIACPRAAQSTKCDLSRSRCVSADPCRSVRSRQTKIKLSVNVSVS
jgi:hypothetical protein